MKQQQGFTLIELMIVMVLMGILAMIGIQAYMSSQAKGRDTARKGNLTAISQALELYYNDVGKYPLDDGVGGIKGCGAGPIACVPGQPFQNAHQTLYMPQLPGDPVVGQKYWYDSVDGTQYQLYTHLENNQDMQRITPSPAGSEMISCGVSAACNYGVSSTNTNP